MRYQLDNRWARNIQLIKNADEVGQAIINFLNINRRALLRKDYDALLKTTMLFRKHLNDGMTKRIGECFEEFIKAEKELKTVLQALSGFPNQSVMMKDIEESSERFLELLYSYH